MARKYGTTAEQSQATRSRLTGLGNALGFEFDYFEGMRMVNTFRAQEAETFVRVLNKIAANEAA